MKKSILTSIIYSRIDDFSKARKIKLGVAKILTGIGFFQFFLALGLYIFEFITQDRALLEFILWIFYSSLVYVLLGSILYKTSSRIIATITALFVVLNFLYITFISPSFNSLLLYGMVAWICCRAAYSTFLIRKNWPGQIGIKLAYPKWFWVGYSIIIFFTVLVISLPVVAGM